MRKAGIREARQHLSLLLDEVRKGREIVITDRGRPVARLAPPTAESSRGLPDLAALRRQLPRLDPPLSASLEEDRADRF